MSSSRNQFVLGLVVLAWASLLPNVHPASAGLIGTSVSADMQRFSSGDIITQFTSPQTVVDPGVEFSGRFTPNAFGQPLAVQQGNSFDMSVDVSAMSLRVMMTQTSIAGAHINFGPSIRVNVTNIDLSGQYLTGITQTSGPAPYAVSLTSPTSIAIDFDDFSERTMDFDLIATSIPEPALAGAAGLGGIGVLSSVRRRRDRYFARGASELA
jgi:hypothetical protein